MLKTVLWACLLATAAQAAPLQKIQLVRSNNGAFLLRSSDLLYEHSEPARLAELRAYAEAHGFRMPAGPEREQVHSALLWVTQQWSHNGINQPPDGSDALDILRLVHEQNRQFRCVEYGKVLSELLRSYGFLTRSLSLRSLDSAYGGFGQGHVAMELFLNDEDKWAFFDPQMSVYVTRLGQTEPLNYLEIEREKQKGGWGSLQVHCLLPGEQGAQTIKLYPDFLNRYFGCFGIRYGSPAIFALLEAPAPPLTFQGMPTNDVVFAEHPEELYPSMNRTMVSLGFRDPPPAPADLMKLTTDEEFLQAMPGFAPGPRLRVQFRSRQPGFDHFEARYASTGPWQRCADQLDWDVASPRGYLEARAVNQWGRPGPATFTEITVQPGP